MLYPVLNSCLRFCLGFLEAYSLAQMEYINTNVISLCIVIVEMLKQADFPELKRN